MRYLIFAVVALMVGCGSGGGDKRPAAEAPPTQQPPGQQTPVEQHNEQAFEDLKTVFTIRQSMFYDSFDNELAVEKQALTKRGLWGDSGATIKAIHRIAIENSAALALLMSDDIDHVLAQKPLSKPAIAGLLDAHRDACKQYMKSKYLGAVPESATLEAEASIDDIFLLVKLNI